MLAGRDATAARPRPSARIFAVVMLTKCMSSAIATPGIQRLKHSGRSGCAARLPRFQQRARPGSSLLQLCASTLRSPFVASRSSFVRHADDLVLHASSSHHVEAQWSAAKWSTVGGASEDVGERHVGFGWPAMPCRAIPCEAS